MTSVLDRPSRNGKTPVYGHVANTLRGQIASGRFDVGTSLPSEHELCRSFGVSRATVRNALRTLTDEGLVKPKAGVGTIVIRARTEKRDASLRGITEDLRLRGIETHSRTLSLGYEAPGPALRERLKLPEGERVLHHVRLRSIAATPFGISHAYIPESVGVTPEDDFSRTVSELIERSHRFHILYGTDVLRARMPTAIEAATLQISTAVPVMALQRTVFVEFDRAVALVDWAIRSDLYEYQITLDR